MPRWAWPLCRRHSLPPGHTSRGDLSPTHRHSRGCSSPNEQWLIALNANVDGFSPYFAVFGIFPRLRCHHPLSRFCPAEAERRIDRGPRSHRPRRLQEWENIDETNANDVLIEAIGA